MNEISKEYKVPGLTHLGMAAGSFVLGGGISLAEHNALPLLVGGSVLYSILKLSPKETTISSVVADTLAKLNHSNSAQPKSEKLPVINAGSAQDTLTLGYNEETRRRFDPAMDDLLGKGMLLAGSQGTGKSNIVGLVARSAGKIGMPFLIIDFKGEFYTLTDVVPNGIVAGHPDGADQFNGGYYPLTHENAAQLAQIMMEGPFQVILDIPSYNGDNDEVAFVIAAFLHGLMDWSRDIKRQGGDPWPCLVITDEAHNFLPESQKLSALVMQHPTESFGALTKAYSRMANTGRSFGYTLLMATQRLPNIAKWSIANLQTKVILAHAEKNDLNACENETGGLIDREEIKRLKQGTGIVLGFTNDPVVVHFDKQIARHVSITPKVEHLKQHFSGVVAPRISQVLPARPSVPKTTEDHEESDDLSVDDHIITPVQDRLRMNVDEPENTVPTPDQMVLTLGPQDGRFSPEQANEFLTRYRKKPMAIKEILRQMDNGHGLGNKYCKHASWLLKITGEVKS